MKIKECPFCGWSAEYDKKEMRIQCKGCGAVVWFDFDVPGECENEDAYIEAENIRKWNNRKNQNFVAQIIYDKVDREIDELKRKLWSLAKYGQLAAGLSEARQLIGEISDTLDDLEGTNDDLKLIQQLLDSRQQENPET